jgi:Ni/Fe-hydrogenase subunit HybB-like protein
MVIAPTKVHPLWYTPALPALFLMSAIAVGFPMVIFESILASRSFKLRPERELLSGIAMYTPVLLAAYLAVKIADLVERDAVSYIFEGSLQSVMFLVEMGLGVVAPMVILLSKRARNSISGLFTAASLVIFGVALNRINVFLISYTPLYPEKSYFPSPFEILVTVGLISTLVLVYRALVMIFPVIAATPEEAPREVLVTAQASEPEGAIR